MSNLWHLHPVLRRLEILLKHLLPQRAEIPFQKYEVAPRPGAESLRRRLLLRPPGLRRATAPGQANYPVPGGAILLRQSPNAPSAGR